MPDIDAATTTAGATTTTTVTGDAPAADTEPAAPAKAPSIAEIKAQRREKTPPKSAASPASAASAPASATPPPAVEPKTATATIEMDAAALKQFSTLSRELRDSKARTKELEGKIAGFGKFEKAQALAKDGKHYDAAREAGIDVDAALAELLGKNGNDVTTAQVDRELAKRLETLEQDKLERDKRDDDRKRADAAAETQRDRDIAGRFVTDNAAKYPYLAKSPRFVDGAFADYTQAKGKAEAEEGRALNDEESTRLFLAALAVHEEDWTKTLGGVPTEAKTDDHPAAGIDGAARAGVRQPAEKAPKKLTWEELKAERLAKRRAS